MCAVWDVETLRRSYRCRMAKTTLTRAQAQEGAPGWRYLLGRLMLSVKFPDFAHALAFVNAVGAIAEDANHHPEVDLRWGRVVLAVSSHDVGGISERDLAFAAAVDPLVSAHGGTVQHPQLTEVEIAIDTMDADAIRPFWKAVLGFAVDAEGGLTDRHRRQPGVWFQQLEEPRPVRNRIHLDVTVAHDEAPDRIAAALAAGGTLVSDAEAPAFWILADADGNEACICTWQGREA